jgi:hypothetical protein
MKLLHFALLSLSVSLPAQAREIGYGEDFICHTQQQAEIAACIRAFHAVFGGLCAVIRRMG